MDEYGARRAAGCFYKGTCWARTQRPWCTCAHRPHTATSISAWLHAHKHETHTHKRERDTCAHA
eukprot:363761-Chlamydomonas_euryale.AAC.31